MKTYTIILILLLLVVSFSGSNVTSIHTEPIKYSKKGLNQIIQATATNSSIEEEPISLNIIPNGKFDEKNADGSPNFFSSSGTGITWAKNNYTGLVHSGSRALAINATGAQFPASTSIYRYVGGTSYLNQSISLDFWIYVTTASVIQGDYVNMRLQFYDTVNHNYYYIYYYILYNNLPTGSGVYRYVGRNVSQATWTNLNENITQLFQDKFGIYENIIFQSFYFYTYSSRQAEQANFCILDDFLVANKTGYAFLQQDFESTNNWDITETTTPSEIKVQSDANRATVANLTVSSGRSTASISKYWSVPAEAVLINESNQILSLDWYYHALTGGGGSQIAYLNIQLQNTTYNTYIYILFGFDIFPGWGNYSTTSYNYLYINASNVNNLDQWNNYNVNLYSLLKGINVTKLELSNIRIRIENSETSIATSYFMLDNLELKTDPLIDSGFEDASYDLASNPIRNWYRSGMGYPAINRTTDAHSGKYALNISIENGEYTRVYRNMYYKLQPEYYTDFWWKINKLDITAIDYMEIQLQFDSYMLRYVIANTSTADIANNGTYEAAYYITSQENQWQNLRRNIQRDLNAVFGTKQWNLTQFSLYASNLGGTNLEFLFDDLHFIADTHPPEIYSVSFSNTPKYYNDVQVEFDSTDLLSQIAHANVFYKTSGNWNIIDAVATNTTHYIATIPAMPYNSTVYFYINVTDTYNNSANSGPSYYSYSIGDDIAPIVSISTPYNNSHVSGDLIIIAESTDLGSNITKVELTVDGQILDNTTTPPFTFAFNTREYTNGIHNIQVNAYDTEQNKGQSQSIVLNFVNDLLPPEISEVLLTSIKEDQIVNATVAVTDQSNISSVTLYYKIDSADWVSLPMQEYDTLYIQSIPAISAGSSVQYYITATDEFGQVGYRGTVANPLSYTISAPEGVAAILHQASKIYENYSFVLGGGSVILLYATFKLALSLKRRKAKKK